MGWRQSWRGTDRGFRDHLKTSFAKTLRALGLAFELTHGRRLLLLWVVLFLMLGVHFRTGGGRRRNARNLVTRYDKVLDIVKVGLNILITVSRQEKILRGYFRVGGCV